MIQQMLIWNHPGWNPVALHLGRLAIHWYGLMYLLGFLWVATVGKKQANKFFCITSSQFDQMLSWAIWGTILGGRIGYVLFYGWLFWSVDPWFPIKIWQGGMSFHGGLIGVFVALMFASKRFHQPIWSLTDWAVSLAPVGIGLGRLGNWINGELWGRPTDGRWGVVYANVDTLPRHPSALYEALLEGLVLWCLLQLYHRTNPKMGHMTGFFLCAYGVFRLICEQFRAPDPQLGFVIGHWLTMGSLLSIPMIFIGILLLLRYGGI